MARFKPYSYDQLELIPVSFSRQILPGTFEYSLIYLIDNELNTSIFHSRFKNDDNGRPAYDPALLLKIVLLAYSRGITSSRKIAQLCQENVLFMAISANTQPHFTTIADFISSSSEAISKLFLQVLLVCDSQGLIGKEMFAIDGCKISSNASKEWSGTLEDLALKHNKMESAVQHILKKHREMDSQDLPDEIRERERKQVEKLKAASAKIRQFIERNEERESKPGHVVQSNITDNESAKIKSSHGVIQGYNGVATVDAKHQVIVQAEAYGSGHEHGILEPSLEAAFENLAMTPEAQKEVTVLADSGFHDAGTLSYLEAHELDGYVVDQRFRSRDPRFATSIRHKHKKQKAKQQERFQLEDFNVDLAKETCFCPAGKPMRVRVRNTQHQGYQIIRFIAEPGDCQVCPLRDQCLRYPHQTGPRQLEIRVGRIAYTAHEPASLTERMKAKVDTQLGRYLYSHRLAVIEPVFGNVRWALGLSWFSLRGRKKVNGQWQLMAALHNLFKIHRYGSAFGWAG